MCANVDKLDTSPFGDNLINSNILAKLTFLCSAPTLTYSYIRSFTVLICFYFLFPFTVSCHIMATLHFIEWSPSPSPLCHPPLQRMATVSFSVSFTVSFSAWLPFTSAHDHPPLHHFATLPFSAWSPSPSAHGHPPIPRMATLSFSAWSPSPSAHGHPPLQRMVTLPFSAWSPSPSAHGHPPLSAHGHSPLQRFATLPFTTLPPFPSMLCHHLRQRVAIIPPQHMTIIPPQHMVMPTCTACHSQPIHCIVLSKHLHQGRSAAVLSSEVGLELYFPQGSVWSCTFLRGRSGAVLSSEAPLSSCHFLPGTILHSYVELLPYLTH